MASKVQIVNIALTLLGESRIISIDDDVKQARESKALYDHALESLLAGYNWSFAKARRELAALADPPDFGYALKYQLPSDALRLIQVGEFFAGLDLTDYRGAPNQPFEIEGREILTDLSAPLRIRYVKRVTDTTQFSSNFTMALGAYLASLLAEPLTQSNTKRVRAIEQLQQELSMAVRANAIELPPQKLADDEWLTSRL